MPTPIIVVGDSPWGPTGLGRIARDVSQRLRSVPGLEVYCLGWEAEACWGGHDRYMGHQDTETWGARALTKWWPEVVPDDQYGIVLSIWDPARCYGLRQAKLHNDIWWGYFPIDAHNRQETIGGPAAEAVRQYHRVLAYGRYGDRVLSGVRGDVEHLPHGIDRNVFYPRVGEQKAWEVLKVLTPQVKPDSLLLGCVATNQPRKDLALLCETVAELRRRDSRYKLWLHTDLPVKAWSIPQLLTDFGLHGHAVVTYELEDAELAALYSYCGCTIAPGLGEGFGYPIVESLSCGTPVVHGTYGGGTELVPCPDWVFPGRGYRYESPYTLIRPVYQAVDVANAVESAVQWRIREPQVVSNYCTRSVEHLDWDRLWSCWEGWITRGLEALR